MSQYFTNDNNLRSEYRNIIYKYEDYSFNFTSDLGVFSKDRVDFGSKLLVENYFKYGTKKRNVLDVGCGYGFIGITISKIMDSYVDLIDVNKRAVHLSKMNVSDNKCDCLVINSDGYLNVSDKFDYIITNPPIRVGKTKLYELMIDSKNYLNENGVIYLVIRKEQGAKSFIKDMSEYYNVNVLEKSKGFYIISLKCC